MPLLVKTTVKHTDKLNLFLQSFPTKLFLSSLYHHQTRCLEANEVSGLSIAGVLTNDFSYTYSRGGLDGCLGLSSTRRNSIILVAPFPCFWGAEGILST